jgi:hypothetical protein
MAATMAMTLAAGRTLRPKTITLPTHLARRQTTGRPA